VSVQQACRLAASEGLRWPFQDAAPEVRDLVARHHAASIDRTQGAALDGYRASSERAIPRPRDRVASLPNGDSAAPLIDALTAKELEVLNHLSELLTTEEIAATMFVSVNTVRTHVRSILRKLSVSRRHQAVRRARALDILSS
jgi:LuxR family maltose regulon positive regulatory protein